jgi:predicted Zn-dependent peptidase
LELLKYCKFTTDSFNAYVDAHYHSENMYLSIVGDADHEEVAEMVV